MGKFEWTESKLRILRNYYAVVNNSFIAEHLECSREDVRKKAEEMGLKKPDSSWTEEDDEYLKNHYADASWEDMIGFLDRKQSSIRSRAVKLGLMRVVSVLDEEYIMQHYNGYNLHQLAKELNANSRRIYEFIRKSKIHKEKMPLTPEIKRKRFEVTKALNEGRTKKCAICGNISDNPIQDFYLMYKSMDGLEDYCKICSLNIKRKSRALNQINKQAKEEKDWKQSIQKQEFTCKSCGEIFKGGDMAISVTDFKVRNWCKQCYNKQHKENSIQRMMKKARGEI